MGCEGCLLREQGFGKLGLRGAGMTRPWGQKIGSNDKHNEWKLFIGQVPLEVRRAPHPWRHFSAAWQSPLESPCFTCWLQANCLFKVPP